MPESPFLSGAVRLPVLVCLVAAACSDPAAPGSLSPDSSSLAASAEPTAPPITGVGEGVITSVEITSEREAGGNSIQTRVLTGTVTGELEGSFVEDVRGLVHESGRVVFSGTMTFTGTVGVCGEGTITLGLSGRGEIPVPGFPITEASVRVIRQPGNTVDVTGTGTVSQIGPDLSYEIRYVCR